MKKSVVKSFKLLQCPADKPLFKYLKKEYANKLFDCGELRIGTLYEFRRLEQYGAGRGDEGEGTKEIYEHIKEQTVEDPSQNNPLSDFAKQRLNIKDTAKNTRLEDITFSEKHDSVDCYIYCMSREFDKNFYEKFGADVCVKIRSPYKFIKSISIDLQKYAAAFVGLSQCTYTDRRQQYGAHDDCHASIIKPVINKFDKEVRAIWTPKNWNNNDLNPLIINLKIKYVKRNCEIFHKK